MNGVNNMTETPPGEISELNIVPAAEESAGPSHCSALNSGK